MLLSGNEIPSFKCITWGNIYKVNTTILEKQTW